MWWECCWKKRSCVAHASTVCYGPGNGAGARAARQRGPCLDVLQERERHAAALGLLSLGHAQEHHPILLTDAAVTVGGTLVGGGPAGSLKMHWVTKAGRAGGETCLKTYESCA